MTLQIARGTMSDLTDADRLIREAADWLTARGMALWGPGETNIEDLEYVTRSGELVMARLHGEPVSCMYLHTEDRLFWPQVPEGEAFYIHRLAVARKYAGRGFSLAMLDWAAGEVRATGRRYVRLDCEPRPKLLELYHRAGFVPIDASPYQVGAHFVIRHEKRVAPDS